MDHKTAVTQILPNSYSPDLNTNSSVWQLIYALYNTFGVSHTMIAIATI